MNWMVNWVAVLSDTKTDERHWHTKCRTLELLLLLLDVQHSMYINSGSLRSTTAAVWTELFELLTFNCNTISLCISVLDVHSSTIITLLIKCAALIHTSCITTKHAILSTLSTTFTLSFHLKHFLTNDKVLPKWCKAFSHLTYRTTLVHKVQARTQRF